MPYRLNSAFPMPTTFRAPFALVATILSASIAVAQDGTPMTKPAQTLPAIGVSEVALLELRDRIVASGFVEAVEQVQVQPLIEGQAVDTLMVDVGDIVEAGQVLARLSTSSLALERSELLASRAQTSAAIAQAEAVMKEAAAEAAEAERVATRTTQLADRGTVAQAQSETATAALDAVRSRVRAAEFGVAAAAGQKELVDAQIATLDLELARTDVRSPVAGLVVARNAELGAISSATGTAMFTIVRDGAMEMRADLAEQDLLRVLPGQTVSLSAIGRAEPFSGTVRLVEPSIDRTTRLGRARITIDDPLAVAEGMFLTAEILVDEGKTLAVPATAVSAGTGGPSVMRVENGVVARVAVATGIHDGGLIEIADGLAANDVVVTKAAAFVRDGDGVDPIRDPAR